MNRDLLDALGAVAADFYIDCLERYPDLLLDRDAPRSGQEGLAVRRLLMMLDEVFLEISDVKRMLDHRARRQAAEREEDLPF